MGTWDHLCLVRSLVQPCGPLDAILPTRLGDPKGPDSLSTLQPPRAVAWVERMSTSLISSRPGSPEPWTRMPCQVPRGLCLGGQSRGAGEGSPGTPHQLTRREGTAAWVASR